jgi:hypothetical protein
VVTAKQDSTILLMQSAVVCILSVAFVMEMLELHYQCPDGGQHIGHVFAVEHHCLSETGTFMPLAHIGHGSCIVLNEVS